MMTSRDATTPTWRLPQLLRNSDFLVVGVLLATIAVLAVARSTHYLFFHTMAEILAIVVSFSIFVLTWISSRYLVNGYLIVLGGSYAAVGLVDVLHTLTFRGMNLFPGVSTNYPTQFWLIARFLEALALLCAPFAITKKPNFHAVSAAFAGVAVVACVAVMAQWFPATFVDGVGLTAFKVYGEYLIITMLVVGFIMLYRFKHHFQPRIFFLLVSSLFLAVATEFCFTRYGSFYDFTNELGHYFRFLSVALAFMAIVLSGVRQPFELIFREMARHKRELGELNTRLVASEGQLNRAQAVAKVGSWYLNMGTKVLTWSDETYRMFGVPVGTTQTIDAFASYVHPDDLASVLSGWNGALAGHPYDLEHRIVVGDQVRWVREVAEVTFGVDGTALAGLGTVQDITERKLAQEAERESEERYRLLFKTSIDGILLTAPDGRIFSANQAACDMLGCTEEELRQLGCHGVVDNADPGLASFLEERSRTGRSVGERVFMRKDGTKFPCDVSSTLYNDKNGKLKTSVIFRDITERRRIEAALRDSDTRMSAVFQASPIGIVISRIDSGRILDVNDACLRLYNYTRDEALGRTVAELSTYAHPEQRAKVLLLLREHGRVDGFLIDFRTQGGKVGMLEMSGRLIELQGEPCLLAMLTDVTERKRAEALIHAQAFHDALTQLPNRRLLGNRLQQAMITAKRSGCYGALMFLDLDNFKPLNDAHGHEVGDLLLIEAAARLKRCVREVDTVARVGGDEFVVMLGALDSDQAKSTVQAAAVAEKIRHALSSSYHLTLQRAGQADNAVLHHCSASIGVTLFVNDAVSRDDMLNRADVAMYQAKRAGRNSIRFYDSNV